MLLCIAACLACATAHAQTVYRCGPDGRVYSQAPCPQGRAVDVSDPRSAQQRAAAEARVRDEQLLGDTLERDRLARESGQPAGAALISMAPTPGTAASTHPPKPKTNGTAKKPKAKATNEPFTALAPGAKPKKAKKPR